MDIELIRETCLQIYPTQEEIKWNRHLCFTVHEKIYLTLDLDAAPISACFKVPKEDFIDIANQHNFKQAPYFAKGQWLQIEDISLISKRECEHYIQQSFNLIKSQLPKRVQDTLNKKQKTNRK